MFKLNFSAKTRLLSGASLLALVLGAPASATTLGGMTGRTASQIIATKPPVVSTPSNVASASSSLTNAANASQQSTRDLTAAVAAIKNQMSAQDAAHIAAQTAGSAVANGLTAGGVVPDSGLKSDGTANDVITWVNASTPTQTKNADGSTTITIKQSDQKAIANWSSFNVGSKTTVYFDQSAGTASDGSNSWVILNRIAPTDAAPSQIFGTVKADGSVYLLNSNGVIFGGSSQVNTRSLVVSSLNLFDNNLAKSNNRFLTGGIGDLNQANYQDNEVLFRASTADVGDIKIEKGADIEVGANGLILMAAPNVTNDGKLVAPKGQVALVAGIGVAYDYNKLGFTSNAWTIINGVDTQVLQGYNDGLTSFLDFASFDELFDAAGNDITPRGTATNNGLIYTTEGNITLAGANLVQNGVLAATTSVKSAGSISLFAMYEMGSKGASAPVSIYDGFSTYYTGTINFGKNSVTTILPSDDGATIPSDNGSLAVFDRTNQPNFGAVPTSGYGQVFAYGASIDLAGGSLIFAPSQNVVLQSEVAADPRISIPDAGRVLVESGAIVDVSGLADVRLSISDNLLTVTLAGNELANDPLQRDGVLYGKTITVDLRDTGNDPTTGEKWVGTDIATLDDYLNLVQNSVSQLMTNGGTISIRAPEVIAEKGSILDVMGGYQHFLGAWVATTKLIDQNGNLVDIANADPLRTYVGVAGQSAETSTKWGVSTAYTNGLLNQGTYESDYIEGGKGGTLSIAVGNNQSPNSNVSPLPGEGALVLQSTVLAGVVVGDYQLSGGTVPMAGSITINGIAPIVVTDPSKETGADWLAALDVPQGFDGSDALLAQDGSPYITIVLSSSVLDNAGAANISIGNPASYNAGGAHDLTVTKGTTLQVQNGGSITLETSGKAEIDGTLIAHAGTVAISTSPDTYDPYNPPSETSDIDINSGALIDVSGVFANEYRDGAGTASTQYINGGTIKLIANPGVIYDPTAYLKVVIGNLTGNITVDGTLDLSSGGLVLPNGNLMTGSNRVPVGQGGNLTLSTYYGGLVGSGVDGNFSDPITNTADEIASSGYIRVDGTVNALGFAGGGTLTIGAVAMQIGGDAATLAHDEPDAYYFDPVYWGNRGFGTFHLSAVQEINVPDGTTVAVTHKNLVLDGFAQGAPAYQALENLASGAKVSDVVQAGQLTGSALTPTDLYIVSGTENYGTNTGWTGDDEFYLGKGASIITDPGADVSLNTYAMVDLEGAIIAHGGSISANNLWYANVNGGGIPPVGPIYLGTGAVLDVSGTTLLDPAAKPVYTANGWVTPKTGKVLAGGTITLNNLYSPILVAPGAVLDVSGAAATLQYVNDAGTSAIGSSTYTVTNQSAYSDPGTVNIQPGYLLIFEGTLKGDGGAPDAAGGTFALKSIANNDTARRVLLVQDTQDAMAATNDPFSFDTYVPATSSSFYNQVNTKVGSILFGVDSLKGTGFDNVSISSSSSYANIYYEGKVSIDVPGTVTLNTLQISGASDTGYSPLSSASATSTWDPIQQKWVYNVDKASLSVDAGYLALGWQPVAYDSYFGSSQSLSSPSVDGSVSLHGKTVDVIGTFGSQYAASVTIASDGEIRLLPLNSAILNKLAGSLSASGDVTLIGTAVYPASATTFTIATPGTLTIAYPDGEKPSTLTPMSVGGILALDAKTINQNGELWAPFGQIIIGLTGNGTTTDIYGHPIALTANVLTQAVNLGDGSITTVSADGATLPFGTTIDDETWIYDPYLNHQNWYNSGVTLPDKTSYTISGTPQGVVTLNGAKVTMADGAAIDLSGGGDVQAAEWINGTGGTRNALLNKSDDPNKDDLIAHQYSSDLGTIYAIIPGYAGANSPYDVASSSQVAAGQRIYLTGIKGLSDGWYTLMPAAYASQPGAYRIVVTSTTDPMASQLGTLADGTVVTQGWLGNAYGNSRSSDSYLVQVQSGDVWKQYSEYAINDGDTFFPAYATKHGLPTPYTAIDAGRLVISAGTDLDLGGKFNTAAGKDADGNSGNGAQLDLSGNLIEITATADQAPEAGYTAVSADLLDSLDFASILIGGSRTNTANGTLINITSNGVIVANNADHPLQAPEILLVAKPATTTATIASGWYTMQISVPVADTGKVVLNDGSVVKATGVVGKGGASTLLLGTDPSALPALPTSYMNTNTYAELQAVQSYYDAVLDGSGSLVRVSNGDPVTVKKIDTSAYDVSTITASDTGAVTALPSLANDAGLIVNGSAQLLGGNSLTLASTGDVTVDGNAVLGGKEIDATSSQIVFLGAGAKSADGLNISKTSQVNLANAATVNLQSSGKILFESDVDLALSGDTSSLTLGGNALASDGGKVTITAGTVTLDNELGDGSAGFAGGSGSLAVTAGTIDFGAGNKTLQGFGSTAFSASKGVVGSGTGTMDFGTLNVTLQTPIMVADSGSTETIKTTGDLSVAALGGARAMTSNATGGALTLQGGSVNVAVPVQALAGAITLKATDGDVVVGNGGALIAKGVTQTFVDKTVYNYAGSVQLVSDDGKVDLASGSTVDVSGIGGSLGIQGNDVAIDGTLNAAPIAGFAGASFALNSKGSVNLDGLVDKLSAGGFNQTVEVTAGTGDLSLSKNLTAHDVLLDAESGQVAVTGTIDASGQAGGTIELFGSKGVDVEGSLIARGSASDQLGGTVMLGSSGSFDPATGTYNSTYGYENIASSGPIVLGNKAVIDVSGGTVNGKSGGTVLIRTPLLQDGTVNVSIADGAKISGARSVTLEPYATWSTADQTGGVHHFDGAVDPAGWYSSTGTLLPGSFSDYTGTTIASWDGSTITSLTLPSLTGPFGSDIVSFDWDAATQTLTETTDSIYGTSTKQYVGTAAVMTYLLANDYFAPTSANTDHETFYGYQNGTVGGGAGTLMGYIQGLNVSVANSGKIANFQVAPGVELKNPAGDIAVLTNWNLGATDSNGNLLFRTAAGIAPILTLRASGNLNLDASISDGFIQVGNTIYTKLTVPVGYDTYSDALALYKNDSLNYGLDALQSFGFLTPGVLAANGMSLDDMLEIAPFGIADLGLPAKDSYDAYYAIWRDYEDIFASQYFKALQNGTSGYYGMSANGFTLAGTTADALTAAGVSGWTMNAIVQFAQDAQTYLAQAQTDTAHITSRDDYENYLSDYDMYLNSWSNWSQYLGWGGLSAATLPLAPVAPPKSLASQLIVPTPQYPSAAGANSPNVTPTAFNQAAINGMALNNEAQSSSYRLVAGARQTDANPLAVAAGSGGNVTMDGYTLIRPNSSSTYVIGQPTTVRTGTGNIDIAASGDFVLENTTLPGAVYTAGKAATAPTADDAATLALTGASVVGQQDQPQGNGVSAVITSLVNPTAAGDISLSVGGDIVGVELAYDSLGTGVAGGQWNSTLPSGLSSNPGALIAQLWTAWLLDNPNSPNVPWYVNFGSFDQGIMSTGGNVTVTAAGDIRDLAVSLPTTAYLDADNVNHVFGGGNLTVKAGGSILSGDYFVGDGSGSIRAGGSIGSDLQYSSPKDADRSYAVPTVLGVQYASIDVASRLSAEIGGAYDPTYMWTKAYDNYNSSVPPVANYVAGVLVSYVPYLTSMSGDSGVSVRAASGDVSFNTLLVEPDLIANGTWAHTNPQAYDAAGTTSLLLPSSLQLVSFDSDVKVAHGGGLYPSATGTLQLLAEDSVDLYVATLVDQTTYVDRMGFPNKGNISGYALTLLDYPVGAYNPATNHSILPTASAPIMDDASALSDVQLHDASLWQQRAENGVEPVRVYAVTGDITDGLVFNVGSRAKYTVGQLSLIPNSPAEIYAAGDITDLPFFGENYQTSDITSVTAGGSISYNLIGSDIPNIIELAGPGSLQVDAGGDILFKSQRLMGIGESGIITIGDQVDTNLYLLGVTSLVSQPSYNFVSPTGHYGNPTLPTGGADVTVIYGARYGMDTTDFIDSFIKAGSADAVSADYLDELNAFLKKQKKGDGSLDAEAAWTAFQNLPDLAKRLFVTEVYFDILDQTGIDYNDASSDNYQKYGRGYEAINTLFPSAWGYTANSLDGGSNGANTLVNTGLLDIRGSRIQTGQGGNIAILGPGGRVLVGSASASVAANPASEGIITFESGNIDIFADQSILVAQSRIMTEQGGNLVIWSSNGDINAGKGAKTAVSNPPPVYACDITHYCVLDTRGVVTGAGIASLQTLEDSPLGNVDMVAPRGTVDAGAAGIRVSGNLNIAAMYVANAFNITVKGTAIGVPTLSTNLNLATVSNAATEAMQILDTMKAREPQNTVDVEVTGFGGDVSKPDECVPNSVRPCK